MTARRLLRIINSAAPIRICDNGGWTDTWFAKFGRVFNIAVCPRVEVQVLVYSRTADVPRALIHAENYDESFSIDFPVTHYPKHPLIAATLGHMGIPEETSVEISIHSDAPGACSTGTSAAVGVALIGALDRLAAGRMTPYEIARAAQRIESELLKQQCGIQDQIACAYGGINFIDMHEYPHATVTPVRVPAETLWELESRLELIYVGQTHCSSATHEMVIRSLEDAGPEAPLLRPLRSTAEAARDALYAGDFKALGRSMIANTEGQRRLHPALVGSRHQQIIDLAQKHGALGWKVNGAGGEGGSVTLLGGVDAKDRRRMVRAVLEADEAFRRIAIALCPTGVSTWTSEV